MQDLRKFSLYYAQSFSNYCMLHIQTNNNQLLFQIIYKWLTIVSCIVFWTFNMVLTCQKRQKDWKILSCMRSSSTQLSMQVYALLFSAYSCILSCSTNYSRVSYLAYLCFYNCDSSHTFLAVASFFYSHLDKNMMCLWGSAWGTRDSSWRTKTVRDERETVRDDLRRHTSWGLSLSQFVFLVALSVTWRPWLIFLRDETVRDGENSSWVEKFPRTRDSSEGLWRESREANFRATVH